MFVANDIPNRRVAVVTLRLSTCGQQDFDTIQDETWLLMNRSMYQFVTRTDENENVPRNAPIEQLGSHPSNRCHPVCWHASISA